MPEKLVYKDGNNIKTLRGTVTNEDSIFIEFITVDKNSFRINKSNIISIKRCQNGL